MFYVIHIFPDRVLVTNRVEDYVDLVIHVPPKGELLATFTTFIDAYMYARDIADRFGWVLEWYFGWAVLEYIKEGRVDRVLVTSKLEDMIECHRLGIEKCKEHSYHLSFLDAYLTGRDLADLWGAVLEWYLEDEAHLILETTMSRPVSP